MGVAKGGGGDPSPPPLLYCSQMAERAGPRADLGWRFESAGADRPVLLLSQPLGEICTLAVIAAVS